MLLKGSCHCQAVTFRLESPHPYPFNVCYCGICRKTAGAGGFVINLGGDHETLEVEGKDHVRVYRARGEDGDLSPLERHFCGECGTMLWAWDPRWPELVHPFASAIDTDLPVPPERTHLMHDYKPRWVADAVGPDDKIFGEYPDESIAGWHERLKLER
ncbi:MAG: GFA family protein [Alphaproteobacteria bacterium]|nr:GFA family protein [Alphaproteobacteria bacterium]